MWRGCKAFVLDRQKMRFFKLGCMVGLEGMVCLECMICLA